MTYQFQKISLTVLVAAGLISLSKPAAAALSFDEFLDYSVKDLQTRMTELGDTNVSLRQKCDAIRSRILLLRQEMRNLDDRKMQLQENATAVQEAIDYMVHQEALFKDHTSQTSEHSANLRQEAKNIQALLDRVRARQEEIRAAVEKLQKDVADLKTQSVNAPDVPTDPLLSQKDQLRKMIAEENGKATIQEKDISAARNRGYSLSQNKMTLETETGVLKAQKESVAAEIKSLADEQARLHKLAEKTDADGQKISADAQNEIGELKNQVDSLQLTVRDFEFKRDRILREAAVPQSFYQLKDSLIQQKQILTQSEEQLAQTRNLLSEKQKQEARLAQELKDKQAGLNAQLATAQQNLETAQKSLAEQQARQAKFVDEEKTIRAEIAKLKIVPPKNNVDRDQMNERKKELAGQITEQEKKNSAIQKETAQREAAVSKAKVIRDNLKNEQDLLKVKINVAKKNIETLDRWSKDAAARVKNSAVDQKTALDQVQTDIADMEYRKSVLAGSVRLIQARYNNEASAVKEFQNEEAQLNQYQSVLNVENQGLKEKEQSLLKAINNLKNN